VSTLTVFAGDDWAAPRQPNLDVFSIELMLIDIDHFFGSPDPRVVRLVS
jgi:hypothetical protein